MNKIKPAVYEHRSKEYLLKELILDYQQEETAFVGQCGGGPSHKLYLIAYENVILASNPGRS